MNFTSFGEPLIFFLKHQQKVHKKYLEKFWMISH